MNQKNLNRILMLLISGILLLNGYLYLTALPTQVKLDKIHALIWSDASTESENIYRVHCGLFAASKILEYYHIPFSQIELSNQLALDAVSSNDEVLVRKLEEVLQKYKIQCEIKPLRNPGDTPISLPCIVHLTDPNHNTGHFMPIVSKKKNDHYQLWVRPEKIVDLDQKDLAYGFTDFVLVASVSSEAK